MNLKRREERVTGGEKEGVREMMRKGRDEGMGRVDVGVGRGDEGVGREEEGVGRVDDGG